MRSIVIALILVILTAGCLGEGTTTTSQPREVITPPSPTPTVTETLTSTEEARSFPTAYTYWEHVEVNITITIEDENETFTETVRMAIERNATVEGTKAYVNSTITTLPDNIRVPIRLRIEGNKVYTLTPNGWIEETNETLIIPPEEFAKFFLDYNPVALSLKYGESYVPFLSEDEVKAILVQNLGIPNATMDVKNSWMRIEFEGSLPVSGTLYVSVSLVIVDSLTGAKLEETVILIDRFKVIWHER
ncbi:hypothetical protein [Pyrococcus yayanosii]|uniref:Uncharacterized protein n=1 Tax=Pyrococcus yayanosii (strain CH1 / JCM 16557) TaxID=529709 RepID=F8AH72_PYRYC|nr:hypothetical protein [Pyrococcus yayanosii]AEH25302.1 hypothetical protein PYCH_16360 [Pyrococcus yayanosii CH1]